MLTSYQGVFPAFFTLYVTKERRSAVQAMQLSNGIANPASLWFGHLMFDGMFGIIVSIIIAVVFSKVSTQFSYIPLYVSSPARKKLPSNAPIYQVVCYPSLWIYLDPFRLLYFAIVSFRSGGILHCRRLPSGHVHVGV